MITQTELHRVLAYDAETGIFTWRAKLGQRSKIGAVAGGLHCDGYLEIQIHGAKYLSHRLAWLYVHGVWPTDLIDHRDGVRTNNTLSNLREANHSLNLQNQRHARTDNGTGLLGATRNKNRFKAVIAINGVRTYLGNFKTPEAAHAAYIRAKRELHPGNQL